MFPKPVPPGMADAPLADGALARSLGALRLGGSPPRGPALGAALERGSAPADPTAAEGGAAAGAPEQPGSAPAAPAAPAPDAPAAADAAPAAAEPAPARAEPPPPPGTQARGAAAGQERGPPAESVVAGLDGVLDALREVIGARPARRRGARGQAVWASLPALGLSDKLTSSAMHTSGES